MTPWPRDPTPGFRALLATLQAQGCRLVAIGLVGDDDRIRTLADPEVPDLPGLLQDLAVSLVDEPP